MGYLSYLINRLLVAALELSSFSQSRFQLPVKLGKPFSNRFTAVCLLFAGTPGRVSPFSTWRLHVAIHCNS